MPDHLGKYRILRPLGQGAMGEVFLAEDPALGREVAIKTARPGGSFGEEAWARFRREAQIVGALSHPHIVTVYDFGEDQGTHFLVMEYVAGRDLEALLPGHQKPKAELVELLAQACEGLAHAHEAGVIHRDLKPANILVRNDSGRWTAKLTDFGVAQIEQSQLTQEGHFMGTLGYMAPEYLDSAKATVATDLFAMGVMLYEIISGGRRPFPGNAPGPILHAILNGRPEPLTEGDWVGLPEGLKAVLQRCLQRDPSLRDPSAEALAEELRRVMAGQAPQAGPRVEEGGAAAPRPLEPPVKEDTDRLMVVGRGGAGRWMSLRVALRQAPPGSRIVIMPGHYREAVVVDKDVILIAKGEPGSVILEGNQGPALQVLAGHVSVRNLTLRGVGFEPALEVKAGVLELERCALVGEEGPVAKVSGELEIRDCALGPGEGPGLQVRRGGQVQSEDCRFTKLAGGGVEVEPEGRLRMRDGCFERCGYGGLLALESSDSRLVDCRFERNPQAGLVAHSGARVDLRGCVLRENGHGLVMFRGAQVRVEACDVQENTGGGLVLGLGAAPPRVMGGRLTDAAFHEVEGGVLEPTVLQAGPDF